MRIISIKTLKTFWDSYPDSRASLQSWRQKFENSNYKNPQEVINDFRESNFVGNTRIVFNISNNKYRLVAAFRYDKQICWIKFIGTHSQYDKIDVKTVEPGRNDI